MLVAFLTPYQNTGTGGTTLNVLNDLNNRFDKYTYTDVSNYFIEKAQTKFAQYKHKMIYSLLDISKSPALQGIAPVL